ncbi:MAG: hypothetical protein ACI909_001226 [Planctomycetota bacterium]|jgi:uncharacterized protein with HEPN domain
MTRMLHDKALDDLMDDRILQRALERVLEIISESARRVSIVTRENADEIHWREIIGQRNFLAHEYGQIDHEILYLTVMNDMPPLIRQLQILLPSLDD